ncbi:DUF4817 domain-containing protein [Trichonephila clavipes]|nr:DUF4817 domain-containing protein [Trichonephila clavipes]
MHVPSLPKRKSGLPHATHRMDAQNTAKTVYQAAVDELDSDILTYLGDNGLPAICTELVARVCKRSDISEFTGQVALETIHGIPHLALKIYADGSMGDGGISGSGVPIKKPKSTFDIKITNINYCYVFSCQVIYSQFGLAFHQNDHQARRRFVEWAQNEIAVVPDFHKRILFSDEAHFWLNGYVNKQNCRIWSEANPQVYVETPLHSEKLTVWCALWAGGILLQKR